jgi:hypothetical protein
MCAVAEILGYIDPNTSQHVFSLVGPLLAFLATAAGLALASLVAVRHTVASYFQKASGPKKIATISIALAILAVVSLVVWGLIG